MEQNNDNANTGVRYGYARVSTEDQKIETQIEILEKNGISMLNIFSDTVSSYKKIEHRKNLDFLIKNIKPGDSITVVRMDRIARSTKELLTILETLEEKGCTLYSLSENLNTKGALGTLFISMLGVIKQFERELIKERSTEGIKRAKALGKYKGRVKVFKDDEIKTIKNMIKNGIQVSEIARFYKCSRTTLYRYLKEE